MSVSEGKAETGRLVGLKYEPGTLAPRILFKAARLQVLPVLSLAKKYGVPIRRETGLLEVLFTFPEGAFIPESHYALVAGILSEVYRLRGTQGGPQEAKR